jgi:hypothetical protein
MNNDANALQAQGGPVDRAAAADYVAKLSAELANLACHHGLDALGYILDMARLEAENAATSTGEGVRTSALQLRDLMLRSGHRRCLEA